MVVVVERVGEAPKKGSKAERIVIRDSETSAIMSWVCIHSDPDYSQKPRKLTIKEIQYVVSSLRKVKSSFTKAYELAWSHLIDHVVKSLQEIELCPYQLDKFVERLMLKQVTSMCEPGYPMGITTGSAINMQTMLNTFKSSGAADTGSREVQATENLVYVRASPRTDYCTIHMKDKRMGMTEAVSLSNEVDQFTLKDALISKKGQVDYAIHDVPLASPCPPGSKPLPPGRSRMRTPRPGA